MKKRQIIYLILTILFVILSIEILHHTDLSNNVLVSKSIQLIIILYLIRICYGCFLYIRRQYQQQKYSYSIIMNLGLLLFLEINVVRHIFLFIQSWDVVRIEEIYLNTLESFSYFAMLTLPCIIVLSIYAIITNAILIKKEGFRYQNMLGIFLGVLSLIGLLGSQAIYMITSLVVTSSVGHVIKSFVDILLNSTLSYFYTIIIATLYCNIVASRHVPSYDKDFVIILGSKIKEDGTLTPLLKGRVDKAIEFGKKQYENTKKEIYYIPSGGKGHDEVIAEGDAIQKYLLKQGIDKKYILVENRSTSTIENMKFSNDIILKKKKDAKICFSTTNYHVFRSGVIANECGIDCEGMGSKTKWYFYTNALIREFIANLFQEKRRHIGILLIINLSTLVLVLIGYYYHFLCIC